jgi:hypothetical protein
MPVLTHERLCQAATSAPRSPVVPAIPPIACSPHACRRAGPRHPARRAAARPLNRPSILQGASPRRATTAFRALTPTAPPLPSGRSLPPRHHCLQGAPSHRATTALRGFSTSLLPYHVLRPPTAPSTSPPSLRARPPTTTTWRQARGQPRQVRRLLRRARRRSLTRADAPGARGVAPGVKARPPPDADARAGANCRHPRSPWLGRPAGRRWAVRRRARVFSCHHGGSQRASRERRARRISGTLRCWRSESAPSR